MNDQEKQAARFREAARQIGTDESNDALDRVMGKLDLKAKPKLGKAVQERTEEKD